MEGLAKIVTQESKFQRELSLIIFTGESENDLLEENKVPYMEDFSAIHFGSIRFCARPLQAILWSTCSWTF